MSLTPTPCREPQEFAAGDTLIFVRTLQNFPASQGWSLLYEIRGGAAAGPAISFVSVAQGDAHSITVAANVTALWLPDPNYTLAGYAILSSTGERHQIYLANLVITENEVAAAGDEPQKTFAQQMVEQLETVLLAKAGDDLARSQVGDSHFMFWSPEQIRTEHGYWVSVRKNEIALENAKNGRRTGRKIRPLFRVISPGPTAGMFGPGSGYGGW